MDTSSRASFVLANLDHHNGTGIFVVELVVHEEKDHFFIRWTLQDTKPLHASMLPSRLLHSFLLYSSHVFAGGH